MAATTWKFVDVDANNCMKIVDDIDVNKIHDNQRPGEDLN